MHLRPSLCVHNYSDTEVYWIAFGGTYVYVAYVHYIYIQREETAAPMLAAWLLVVSLPDGGLPFRRRRGIDRAGVQHLCEVLHPASGVGESVASTETNLIVYASVG